MLLLLSSDEVSALNDQGQGLCPDQFEDLKVLLSHRVKLRMTLNIRGKVSSVVPSHHHHAVVAAGATPPAPNTPTTATGNSGKSRNVSVFSFSKVSVVSQSGQEGAQLDTDEAQEEQGLLNRVRK